MSALEPHELDELRNRLRDGLEAVVGSLLSHPIARTRTEWRFGSRNGSLGVVMVGSKRGLWTDRALVNASGRQRGGDVLALIRHVTACGFPAAVEKACVLVGYDPPSRKGDLTPEQRRAQAVVWEQDRVQRAAERATREAEADAERQAEDAAKIAKARALWEDRAALEGSPAFSYLVQNRKALQTTDVLPNAVGWHPGEGALITAATTTAGDVTAVQLIRLTPEGHKRLSSGLVKQTVGRLLTDEGRATVRLPARPGADPAVLCHAEGLETGLSVWAAHGTETWVVLGSGVDPQPGRRNVICADDDPPESVRARALTQQAAAWHEAGLWFAFARPWDIPRGDRSDFNDLIQLAGPEAVRKLIRKVLLEAFGLAPAEPPGPLPVATLAEAHRDLARIMREFFTSYGADERPRQFLLTGQGGSGKTDATGRFMPEAIILAKKAGQPYRVIFLVPEHKTLGEQVTARLRALGLNVAHFRGRGDPFKPKADDLCKNPIAAREAIIAKQNVMKSVCGPAPDGSRCPFFDSCEYLANVEQAAQADVVVAAHNFIYNPLSKKICHDVGFVIIDEEFIGRGDRIFDLTVETFDKKALERFPVLRENKANEGATRELVWLHDALYEACVASPDGYLTAKALRDRGLTREDCTNARKLEWHRERPVTMTPGMSLEARREVARGAAINSQISKNAAVWDAVWSILSDGDNGAGRIRLSMHVGKRGISRELTVHAQHHVAAWLTDLPVLMLNATGSLDEVRRFFPRAVERRPALVAAPHAHTTLVRGGFSKSTLQRYPKKTSDLRAWLTVRNMGQQQGIVAHKSTKDAFASMRDTQFAHHGANAGDDSFKAVDTLAVIGSVNAPPADLAAMAAARTGQAVPVASAVQSTATVLMRDGSGVAVPVRAYEHPAVQAVHAGIHNSALNQAAARPRQVMRTAQNPVEVLIFGNAAPEGPVDEIVHWRDIKPDRLVHMVARQRVYVNAADMAGFHPDLFRSEKAAATARTRFGDVVDRVREMVSRDREAWIKVLFQPSGQGQQLRMGFFPAIELKAVKAEIEAKYGGLTHWSKQPFTAGREDIPKAQCRVLRHLGMSSAVIPAWTASSPPQVQLCMEHPPDGRRDKPSFAIIQHDFGTSHAINQEDFVHV